ncbi:MAG: shikimate kinase, partial [Clostridiaceae bacterium]
MVNIDKNIVLIGMPGCGKSTIGKELADKLDIKFCDLD